MSTESTAKMPLITGRFLRLWAFGFITFFSAFQLLPTIPFRILALGGTKAQAGLFLAAYTYASAFSAPLTGTLADHLGRRRLLLFSSAAFILFSLLYAVVRWFPMLFLIGCIHGVLWSAILASSAAIMIEIIPPARRTEGIAYWGMSGTAAIAVAPLIGLTVYRQGWVALCLEMTALSVVMVVLAVRVRGGRERSTGPFPSIGEVIDWRVVASAMSLFVVSFGYGGITSYIAIMSVERRIQPGSLFFTIFAITILVSRFFTGRIGDRYGAKTLLYPSVIVVPFALALAATAETRAGIASAAFLYGVGFGGAYPAFVSYVLGRTDENRRAATFGSILWAFDTGIGTGSFATGLIAQRYGFTAAFLTGALLSVTSIPIFRLASGMLPDSRHES